MSLNIRAVKEDAKYKAIDALARYKFVMFGYWAAMWVSYNKLDDDKEPNPFATLVEQARRLKKWKK